MVFVFFVCFFVCLHSSNTHCVAVYRPISTQFAAFFSEGITLSETLGMNKFVRTKCPTGSKFS